MWFFPTLGSSRLRRNSLYTRPRQSLAFLVAVLAAAICLASWAGDSPGMQREGSIRVLGGPVLSSGQETGITWDSLPPGTEEFELLLQCESPVPLTLRLTESEEPGLRSFTWRVPDLPPLVARIVIRRGEGGHELVWAKSESFRISASRAFSEMSSAGSDAEKERPRVLSRDGELWLQLDAPRAAREEAGGYDPAELAGRSDAAIPAGTISIASRIIEGPASTASEERASRTRMAAKILPRKPLSLQLRI